MDVVATGRAEGSLDRALVLRARDGDRDAFDRLVRDRIERALRTALAITGSEADARDAVQDAFVASWRELPRLREPSQFDAWFGRILVNTCRSALRRRRVRSVREIRLDHVDGEPDATNPGLDPATPAGQDDFPESDAIRRAFGRLRPDARTLLSLLHIDGRSIAEISALLGVPEGTVKWRLHEARKALERALAEERR